MEYLDTAELRRSLCFGYFLHCLWDDFCHYRTL